MGRGGEKKEKGRGWAVKREEGKKGYRKGGKGKGRVGGEKGEGMAGGEEGER